MYLTEKFADFIVNTNYVDLPEDIIHLAKERILDTIGAMLAGEKSWESKAAFLAACSKLGAGDIDIVGSAKQKFPLARAAMINATFAHAIELDDGHKNAGCHAGAVIVPTALTVGAKLGCSGKEILTAVVIGYEVVYRIVEQMTPYQIQKGFHPSSICDTFGAMAVAGKLMGLTAVEIANGLGFAGLLSSGLMEATVSGQQNKCVQVGNAALNGISAAYYAQANLEGTKTVLEGKTGFFHAQAENVDIEKVCADLGKKYRIGDTYSKMYPTCRHSQAAIEAVLDLVEENKFTYSDVDSIWVGTHKVAYDLTGIIKEPKKTAEAKFSMAYGIALALHEHNVGICHLAPAYWEDPVNRKLANLVTVVIDPTVQSYYPKKRGAKVQIKLKDGRILEKELYDLKGSPKNPVDWNGLLRKFEASVTGVLGAPVIVNLIEAINTLEQIKDINTVMQVLTNM